VLDWLFFIHIVVFKSVIVFPLEKIWISNATIGIGGIFCPRLR